MLGRSLISLTSMIFCFLRASFFFFCSSYLYLPKSRILQTGGSAFGAISTRSRPASEAIEIASLRPTIPTILPRWSTRRTRMTPISSLTRGPSRVGVRFKGALAMYNLLLSVDRSVDQSRLTSRRRRCRFLLQSSNGFADRKNFLLLSSESPQRNRTGRRLAPSDDQHDGDLRKAVLADLVSDLFVARIEPDPEARGSARPDNLACILGRLRGDRSDDDLDRREPERETAGIMLDQDRDEPLHRAEDRAVQHDRRMAPAILTDVSGSQPPRHVEIELQRTALPLPAKRVAQVEFELRPVERALAGVVGVGQPRQLDRCLQIALGTVPDRIAANALRRPVGEFDLDIVEAEVAVHRQQQLADPDRLAGDLILGAEDVRVVLGKAAHPHDAVQ